MNVEDRWTALVVASSVVAILAAIAATGNAFSMVPMLWFLAFIPGLPYVRLLKNNDDPVAIGLTSVGLSLAMGALIAEALLYLDAYSAVTTVTVLAVIACAGAVIGRLRSVEDADPADPLGA